MLYSMEDDAEEKGICRAPQMEEVTEDAGNVT
jgi:hypothetical protein